MPYNHNEYMKQWNLLHIGYHTKYSKRYHDHNKEKERRMILKYNKQNPECITFIRAKQRCNNPKATGYKDYGGRGIQFKLNNWHEIIESIGPRPKGLTLDRIDNDGHYEIGNIRWATRLQQVHNRRCSKTRTIH